MSSSKDAKPHTDILMANFFIQKKVINTVADRYFSATFGTTDIRLLQPKPYEKDAISAVAAFLCTDGNLELLAAELEAGSRLFSESELEIIRKASNKVLSHPDFTYQLFNGDATDIVQNAIEKVR